MFAVPPSLALIVPEPGLPPEPDAMLPPFAIEPEPLPPPEPLPLAGAWPAPPPLFIVVPAPVPVPGFVPPLPALSFFAGAQPTDPASSAVAASTTPRHLTMRSSTTLRSTLTLTFLGPGCTAYSA